MRRQQRVYIVLAVLLALAFIPSKRYHAGMVALKTLFADITSREKPLPANTPTGVKKLLASLHEQMRLTKTYDAAYVILAFPNGDVPIERGVCSDVVVRAFRKAGLDLQSALNKDMRANFQAYPHKWGLHAPDPNIDHRRVPNLQTYFNRHGKALGISFDSQDYQPGDVVTWNLDGKGLAHTGMVSNVWSESRQRYLIVHNIGTGVQAEDRLFDWPITGHYRYF